MFANLFLSMRLAVQRAAFSAVAGILMLVGLAFLTVAAWIGLAAAYSTLVAAVVIGCAYMGLGFIILAIASLRRPLPPPVAPAPPLPGAAPVGFSAAGVLGAFVQGIGAGIAASAAIPRRTPPAPPPPPPPR